MSAALANAAATPVSTLRLQFHGGFTLDDAVRWVDYFADLGISHIYSSPLLASRRGSIHGYDGIDPTRLDPELGGEEALERLVSALRVRNMGLILDIVPNHVAVGGSENLWWQDVLMWGRQSRYAGFFDIDWAAEWHAPDPLLQGKVLVPFLGDHYGVVLGSGDLVFGFDPDYASFHVDYHEHRFPIDPRHYGGILEHAEDADLQNTAAAFLALADSDDLKADAKAAREALRLASASADGALAIAALPALFDGREAAGALRLHQLLERQHYRLAWWRTASDEINWRRFFDITELAGLRVEQPEVFEETHAEVFRLVEKGWIDGVRVDHVDGLVDPRRYCRELRARLDLLASRRPDGVPARVSLYVEKILAAGESLHQDWTVDGTTGYEFMNDVSALQHEPAEAPLLRALWREMSGRRDDFPAEERRARTELLQSALASEFDACGRALLAVARADLSTRDFALGAIKRTLAALIRHFSVYRTYADASGRPPQDQPFFASAAAAARAELHPPEQRVLDYLERWLGGEAPVDCADPEERELRLHAISRFQQLTAPVAAKAVEDTAGYRSAVMISRNDVGFDAEALSHPPRAFHAACQQRAAQFPRSLLATATHDHKRGEDVRARLAALSEHGDGFAADVRRWTDTASPLRSMLASGTAPSSADEMILYQTLLGAWPLELDCSPSPALEQFRDRLVQWQQKALREAKLRSHWLWPDLDYEASCRDFLLGLFDDPSLCRDIAARARALDLPGVVNSLAQVTLRNTVPGLPDLYQGTEWWDLSLVDPDNRRPVDYPARQAALAQGLTPAQALPGWRNGQVKQAVLVRLLKLRRELPQLFMEGSYTPLTIVGPQARHVLAFVRHWQDQSLLVVVPRLPAALLTMATVPAIPTEAWQETHVQLERAQADSAASSLWRGVLSEKMLQIDGTNVPVAQLLDDFPVAVYRAEQIPGVFEDPDRGPGKGPDNANANKSRED